MESRLTMILLGGLFLGLPGCRPAGRGSPRTLEEQINSSAVRIVLPTTLHDRRAEFEACVGDAQRRIAAFATANGWDSLTKEMFMDSVMIFDIKKDFDRQLLLLAGEDTTIVLPDTYCGALEKRTLLVVSPELYARAYPTGVEEDSFTKLLIHEIAHRLHIRVLNGNEDAMGPIWFYEGFAVHAADQLSSAVLPEGDEAMRTIMDDPERGSYAQYGALLRRFTSEHPLPELIAKASEPDFNAWLLPLPGH